MSFLDEARAALDAVEAKFKVVEDAFITDEHKRLQEFEKAARQAFADVRPQLAALLNVAEADIKAQLPAIIAALESVLA